jgi:hypothetical protein
VSLLPNTAQTFVENPINTFPYLLRPAGKAPSRKDSLKKVKRSVGRDMVLKEREAAPDPVFKSEDYPFKNTVLREAALPPALKIELLELWQRYRNFKGPFSTRGRVPMDLWVVNDTIRRVQDAGCSGPFRGPRGPDPGGSGAFCPRARVSGKGGCRLGELNRLGGVAAWDQALWSRSNTARAIGAVPGRASGDGLGSWR